MGEHGPLGCRLSCQCHACLVWRRLGEELHLGHQSHRFLEGAALELKECFDKVLNLREVHRLETWSPLAGGTPSLGEGLEDNRRSSEKVGQHRKGSSQEKKRSQGTERSKSRKTKVRRSRSRRRREATKSPSASGRPQSSRGGCSEAERKRKPTQVKSEPTEAELDSRGIVTLGRDRSPDRGGSSRPSSSLRPVGDLGKEDSQHKGRREREEAPPKKRERSIGEEKRQRPPGQWSLRERPAEPSRPPSVVHPPEPLGPPPGWRPPPWSGSRSKGTVRRERQEDILRYGPSEGRKRAREERQRA